MMLVWEQGFISSSTAVVILLLCSVRLNLTNGAEISNADKQLQCYACGLPKVNPNNDFSGSYGTGVGGKRYNESCNELFDSMDGNKVDHAFLRTCPVGVKSCFAAFGFLKHKEKDLGIGFMGCSEAKEKHSYGCDTDLQNVVNRNSAGEKEPVNIEVTLCFCSSPTCNHPTGDLVGDNKGFREKLESTRNFEYSTGVTHCVTSFVILATLVGLMLVQ